MPAKIEEREGEGRWLVVEYIKSCRKEHQKEGRKEGGRGEETCGCLLSLLKEFCHFSREEEEDGEKPISPSPSPTPSSLRGKGRRGEET